jgi:hypothetical protein
MQDLQNSWWCSWASSEILQATIARLRILTSTIFLRDITLCTVKDLTSQSVTNQSSNQDLAVGPPCRRSHANTNTCVTKWNEGRFWPWQCCFVVRLSKHNDVITLYSTYGTYYQVSYYTNYLWGSRSPPGGCKVCGRFIEIVGSNLAEAINVRLLFLLCVDYVTASATSWSLVQITNVCV